MLEQAPLTLQERVRTALDLGESHFREFKSALEGPPGSKRARDAKTIRKDIGEALVAFANADGGELIVGVEDDARVTGIPHSESVIASLLNAWRTHVHPKTPLALPKFARLDLDGELVLYFSVEKSTKYVHLTADGRCMQRRDRESIPASSEQIQLERREKASREYDRVFVDGGDPSVLDLEAVERIGDQIAPGLSPEKVLQLLDLAEYGVGGVRLRRAAVLLLAREVAHWHPRCEVRILRVAGTELRTGRDYNVVADKHATGCILELLSRAWEEIRPYLVETRLGPDGRFEEQVLYPEDACREALTNAIAHRDYSIEGRAIEVFVFDDRLEVRSPGALLSTVTIEGIRRLQGVHQSRNSTIARALRELGYMREMGEGFRRIFQLMSAHDLVEPEIRADDQSFVVSLQHRSVFSEEDQRWIQAYEQFELERDEEKVVLLGRRGDSLSIRQIMDALDLVDTEDYRNLVERLQQKGLILGIKRPKSGGATRNLPRWKVVQPKDANKHYGELLAAARDAYEGRAFGRRDFGRVGVRISRDSPYPEWGLPATFKRLGLTDATGVPSGRLRAILEQGGQQIGEPTVFKAGPGTSATSRGVRHPKEAPQAIADEDAAEIAAAVASRDPTRLFVGNLAVGARAEQLRALCERIAPVREVHVPRDFRRRSENRGYGFVEFQSTDGAKRAKVELEGVRLLGIRVRLEWARS